jgi:hypothetical protein
MTFLFYGKFVGEKILNTKAYIKKIKSIDGGLLPSSFLSSYVTILKDRENSKNHKKQKNNI